MLDRDANRPKEREVKFPFLLSSTMSKVVYRGVVYNTESRPNQAAQPPAHVEVYRGVKFYVDEQGQKTAMVGGK